MLYKAVNGNLVNEAVKIEFLDEKLILKFAHFFSRMATSTNATMTLQVPI